MLRILPFAVWTAVVVAAGQLTPQQPAGSGSSDAILVDVRVVDRLGAPIMGLTVNDFEIRVDGKPRSVLSAEYQAENGTQQSSVVVVADRDNLRVGTSRATLDAAAQFLERLPPSHAVGSLVLPVAKPSLDLGTNRAPVSAALRRVLGSYDPRSAGTTDELALRSALHMVIGRLNAVAGRRTIVYLTDRLDQSVSIADLAQRASLSGVVFYVVAADAPMISPEGASSLAEEVDRDSLVALASATGGAMLRRIAGAEGVFGRLTRELSGQYLVGFAVDPSGDRGRHMVRVAVKRPGVSVRARREFVR
ncbi:MAG TPA: VWA domain-containing protein [Vicinamibacterales bacterium]|nr:VWA domain-containing protein [Vicinamibacterales bacterium]